jgi:hypothetical protein
VLGDLICSFKRSELGLSWRTSETSTARSGHDTRHFQGAEHPQLVWLNKRVQWAAPVVIQTIGSSS